MKTKDKIWIDGFVEGFMSSGEGQNGEYGSFDDCSWNCPKDNELKQIKEKIRLKVIERLKEIEKLKEIVKDKGA